MSLAKIKMGCLCYRPLRILWAAIRNSFFKVNGECHLECSQKRQSLSFVMHCCCVSKHKCWDRRSLFCVITCASSSHLSMPLYCTCSLETQTGIRLSLSGSISQRFVASNLRDLAPLQLRSQARGSGHGHSAPCFVIAVTRLSASSTCLASVYRSSHQSALFEFCTGCVHACKTQADSWQLELRANRRRAQKKCQRDAAEFPYQWLKGWQF